MNNILVVVMEYPDNNGNVGLMYVHSRNLFYEKNGYSVTVLNFKSEEDYTYDGIKVISYNTYCQENKEYDICVLHAANIRKHYAFLKKYGHRFKQLVFFFHGHEVLKINDVYSKPYYYIKENKFKIILQDLYDTFKLNTWRRYFEHNYKKIHFVFVSKWMYENFLKYVKLDKKYLKGRYSITYNCVGSEFQYGRYDDQSLKKYDFITIRPVLDGSKYAIDLVNQLAKNTPDARFLLVGKGDFFNHYKKAENITWVNSFLNHDEIIKYLQKARFALMPTRTDAQGLMMCEMAAFGIPVITSDIPVCHEVFGDFENAYYIDNEDFNQSLSKYRNIKNKCIKHNKYFIENTVKNEVELLDELSSDEKTN